MSAPGTISRETAAKLLMVTPRYISMLVKDGWIQKGPEDHYTTVGVVQGYIKFLKDDVRRNSQQTAQSKAADARAREIELRIAQRERTLVPVDEAVAAMSFAIGAVRAEIEGAAANITRDRELRNRIQDAHDGILKRAAQRIDREVAALRGGGAIAEAVEEDDAERVGAEE